MHEADDAYSIWSTWSCYWLDQFLTVALDAWILSKFSTLYWICLLLAFLVLVGVELPLCYSHHSILECYNLFSGVELSMRSFFVICDTKTEKIPNFTSKFLSQVKTRLLDMTWSNLWVNVRRSFVAIATNPPSCFSINFRTTPEVSRKRYFVKISQVSEKLRLFNHKRADFWLPNFGSFYHLISHPFRGVLGFIPFPKTIE